jgi:hypothetical protein
MRSHPASRVRALSALLAPGLAVVLSLALAACGDNLVSRQFATVDASTGGSPGSGGTATGGANGGGGGASGTGGDGGTVDAGSDGGIDAGLGNGAACSVGTECASGNCVDNLCCDISCALSCYTCASAAFPGTCVPAALGTDPHEDCEDSGPAACQTNGVCDGNGACQLYPAGTVCNTEPPACDPTNTAVSGSFVCDGSGTCAPSLVSCKGFLCSNAACETSCDSDATCATGAFCGAGACVPSPYDIAGNGDLEYGTLNGWRSFAGAAPAVLSDTTMGGIAHGGQYSVDTGGRTQLYQGPAYDLPTGPGKYIISFWGLQQTDDAVTGVAQIQLTCNSGTAQYETVQMSGFGISMPSGVWTQFSGTVDTSAPGMPADCDPMATPPGLVRRAMLYLNQTAAGSPNATPDFFADDLIVQVTDGHNLIGNPNFEAGDTVDWAVAGTGTLAISSTIFNTGTMSMGVTGRTTSTSGPSYALPIGAARYNVSFHALHTDDASPHDLVLQATYTCLGGAQTAAAPIDTAAAVPGNTWTTLSGTVTLPPLDATAGCKLVQAEVHVQQEDVDCAAITCPDIYIDDASITLAE